jgi:hypothetical protein
MRKNGHFYVAGGKKVRPQNPSFTAMRALMLAFLTDFKK